LQSFVRNKFGGKVPGQQINRKFKAYRSLF